MEALFTGGYGPAPLSDAERAAIAAAPEPAPDWVQGEYPEWLEPELIRAFGDDLAQEMAALIPRAPADLRVNTLKATREEVIAALEADGIAGAPTPYAPHGIRIAGEVLEPVQIGACSNPAPLNSRTRRRRSRPSCAMQGPACGCWIWRRARAARAWRWRRRCRTVARSSPAMCGARPCSNWRSAPPAPALPSSRPCRLEHARPEGLFDLVLVDAPCSGSGTWRRQPELRWRLTPARLAELTGLQDRLLDQAAGLVRPGGRLIYATCSILPVENQDRAQAFRARQPGFASLDLAESWPGTGEAGPPPGLSGDFRASPSLTGTDGFYCAGFRRG